MKNSQTFFAFAIIIGFITGCYSNASDSPTNELANISFKDYWYQGKAELSSYHLQQARYGELHDGEVVLIYVTEDFSAEKQVKLDNPSTAGNDKVPILKLNRSTKFNTGLYPYSILTSVFMPVNLNEHLHALKVTTSVQDWCGHVFTQLNNWNESIHVSTKSYFETESDQEYDLKPNHLEDEFWNIIRLNPEKLPLGKQLVIPGTIYTRLKHIELKPYEASLSLKETDNNTLSYTIDYPSLRRTLIIKFSNIFPYQIQGWEEEYTSGWGMGAKRLKSTARLNKTLVTDYWTKNSLNDKKLRNELGLQ